MLEKKVEAELKIGAMKRGGLPLKLVAQGRKGFPDQSLFMPEGRHYLVELKRPKGGKLSDSQIRMRVQHLAPRGYVVYTLWSLEDVDEFWRRYDAGEI